MPKIHRVEILLILPALLACGALTAARNGQSANGMPATKEAISLSISAIKDVVKSGSPVVLEIAMKNTSNHDISYWFENREDRGGFDYLIDVWDDKQAVPEYTKLGRGLKGREDPAYVSPDTPINSSGVVRILKVGEIATDRVSVSKIYDLTRSGKYTIQVRRFDEESKIQVKSNKVTVTVTP